MTPKTSPTANIHAPTPVSHSTAWPFARLGMYHIAIVSNAQGYATPFSDCVHDGMTVS